MGTPLRVQAQDEFGNPAHTHEDLVADAQIFGELVQLVSMDDVRASVTAFLHRAGEECERAVGEPGAFARDLVEALAQKGEHVDARRLAGELREELRRATDSSSSDRIARIDEETDLARAGVVRFWVNQLAIASALWGGPEGVILNQDLTPLVPDAHRKAWTERVTQARESFLAGVALEESNVAELLASLRQAVRSRLEKGRSMALPSFLELRCASPIHPIVVDRGTETEGAGGGTPPGWGSSRTTRR